MSIYRYRLRIFPITKIQNLVGMTPVYAGDGPAIFTDVSADPAVKDDLDAVMLSQYGATYDSTDPVISASAQAALNSPGFGTAMQRSDLNVDLSNLQALGATTNGSIDYPAQLPDGARVFGVEVIIQTGLDAPGLTAATVSMSNASDSDPETMMGALSCVNNGFRTKAGTNPYQSRGEEIVKVWFTLTGANFEDLTIGGMITRVFYVVVD